MGRKKAIKVKEGNAIDKIATLALVENEEINSHLWRVVVSVTLTPVSWDDFDTLRPDVRTTCGNYYLKYCPRNDPWRVPNFPWVLINDMTNRRIVTNGPTHLRALAKEIPELSFILNYSTFSDELFDIAAKHPGIKMPFCLDVVRYSKDIMEEAKKIGKDIDNRPLVSYMRKEKPEDYQWYKLHKFNKSMLPSAHVYDKIIDNMKAKFDKGEL